MRMILAVMYREYRIRTTSLTWLFYDLLVPVVYLLLFGIGLDRAFAGGITLDGVKVSYNAFFLAGVLAMACFGIAINTSYGFFVDRDNGIFYEFLTYPMSRAEFLIGKILFNCLLAVIQAVVTLTLAVAALDVHITLAGALLAILGMVLGTAGWFFFLTSFALRIRRNDVFNTFINVAYFVLMFASSMFYPADSLPTLLRDATVVNPLSWLTDILRFATIGTGNPLIILAEAAAFSVFMLLSFVFALDTLRRGVVK